MPEAPRTQRPAASKVRLDREVILTGALELAATPGVTAISFRELGAHLSVDPTAVYRHFRNKEELMKALLDHLTAVGLDQIEAPAERWRERLQELGLRTLRLFARYPAIGVEAIVLTTNGPAERRAIEYMLDAFTRAGLAGEELVRHYALLATHILSTAANIARARAERGAEASGMWLDEPLLVDPRNFPLIAANGAALAQLRDEDIFLAGVDVILDSAERAALARRRSPDPDTMGA